jgi:hypothetical protein
MAKIIVFYVPSNFRKKATKWIPPEQRGKVIPFGSATTHFDRISGFAQSLMEKAQEMSEMVSTVVELHDEGSESPRNAELCTRRPVVRSR